MPDLRLEKIRERAHYFYIGLQTVRTEPVRINHRQLGLVSGMAAVAVLLAIVYRTGSPSSLFSHEDQRFVAVAGQVTYCDRDRGILFLQAPGKAWRIETAEIEPAITAGAHLEAAGSVNEEFGSSLIQAATLRLLHAAPPLAPATVSAAQLKGLAFANRLVSLTGKIVEAKAERLGQLDLVLQAENEKIGLRIADWTGLIPDHLPGMHVKVEGVLEHLTNGCASSECLTLLMNDRSNLHVLSDPLKASSVEAPSAATVPLTQVSDIHRLSPTEADRHFPVRLTGIVTVSNSRYIFLQDKTGGIFVNDAVGDTRKAQIGQKVTLTGQTGAGQFAPVVIQPHVEANAPGHLPAPHHADLSQILSGSEDSNWIEIEGVIRSASWERNMAYLRAEINGVPFRIAISNARDLPTHLIDAKVKLQGVCATEFNRLRQLVGFYVMTPSVDLIHVEEPARDIAGMPMRPISEFGSFAPTLPGGHRERVRGVVTFHSLLSTYIQDDTGSLQIQPAGAMPPMHVGDRVEAVGFSTPKAFGPVMLEGSIRNLGASGARISPKRMSAEAVLNRGAEGELVSVEATLSDRLPSANGEVLVMRAGHRVFVARLQDRRAPEAARGALLRLTGIPVLQARSGHPYVPGGFSLLLASADGVDVMKAAPWWNARFVLWAVGLAGLVSALVLSWAVMLRKQVRQQTSVIQSQLNVAQGLREQAESAARLKSEFLANMSHEIRTPLNGILGMTELALIEPVSPAVRDYLETARGSGASLLQVINDVLDLSKIEAGHVLIECIPFNLEKSVRNAVAIVKPAAAAKCIDVDLLYPKSAPRWFEGDPSRIHQVIVNLLGNAVKFTDVGGATVEIVCLPAENGLARVRVGVRDTGIGIPADKQSTLFQSFTQADASTSRKYGGTGLGLAISRQLVQLMNGVIGLSSEPGRGSEFWFELPLTLADSPPVSEDAGHSKTVLMTAREGRMAGSILLAEDNPVNQKLATRLLERVGFTVYPVQDGIGAIDRFQQSRFDAILMDCQMPTCDGYEATAAIRKWELENGQARTPIIALTAHALPGDRDRCLESGMDDYLTKPLRAEELQNILHQWIQRSATPAITRD